MGREHQWPSYGLVNRLLIADEHQVVAEGIRLLLANLFDAIHIVGSGGELVEEVRREQPSIVLSEVNMPGISGVDAMKLLHDEGYNTPFLFLTMHDKPATAVAAVRAGARGFVSKCSVGAELIDALESVVQGRFHLDSRLAASAIKVTYSERRKISASRLRVLQLTAVGFRNKDIAREMGLSLRTIESHKYSLMREFGANTTLNLLRKAKDEGLM